MDLDWMDQKCAGPRVRWTDTGQVEIEGEGTPETPFNDRVFQYADLIFAAAQKYSLPPSLIAGVIGLESDGKADAVSFDGGYGLMQITDPSLKRGHSNDELLDPALNIDIGSEFLSKLYNKYDGNPISIGHAYNAGAAYCGGGKSQGETCAPNRWNLVAYCPSPGQSTIDYGSKLLKWVNYAATRGLGTQDMPFGGGALWMKAFAMVVAAAAGFAIVYNRRAIFE